MPDFAPTVHCMEKGAAHKTTKLSDVPGKSPTIALRLPVGLVATLDEMAAKQGRKRSEIIRSILEAEVSAA